MAMKTFAFALLIGWGALASPSAAQVGRNVKIDLSLRAEHDSNVARSSPALAAQRGVKLSDNMLSPEAAIDFSRSIGRNSLFLKGKVGYTFYERNTGLNKETADVQGGVGTRVGPCQGNLNSTFTRRRREIGDLETVDTTATTTTTSVTAGTVCGLTGGLGVSLSASQVWGSTEGGVQNLDYESTAYNAGLVYRRSALGEARIFYSHGETEYEDVAGALGRPGFETDSVGLSYSRALGSRLTGTAMVSQTEAKSTSTTAGSSGDFSGTNYALSASYRPSSRLDISLALSRDISPSTQVGRLFTIREGYSVDASYKIGSRFTYTLGAGQRRYSARGTLGIGGTPVLRSSRVNELTTSLRYSQNERLSFILDASHIESNTNDPLFDFEATRVGITTSVSF